MRFIIELAIIVVLAIVFAHIGRRWPWIHVPFMFLFLYAIADRAWKGMWWSVVAYCVCLALVFGNARDDLRWQKAQQ